MCFGFHGLRPAICTLTALSLPFCGLTSISIAVLLSALVLSDNQKFLGELDLSYNNLTGKSIHVLGLFMREMKLSTLSLRGNALGGGIVDIDRFEEFMGDCSSLLEMDLSFIKTTSDENAAIIHGLRHCITLCNLRLDGLTISASAAIALSNAVAVMPRMQRISLEYNASCAGEAFLKKISKSLEKGPPADPAPGGGVPDILRRRTPEDEHDHLMRAAVDNALSREFKPFSGNEPSKHR